MASITTINSGDNISSSRSVINTNFSNLNNDKIETSYLDTDTTLSANSDTKIATQRAVKAYVDTGGNVNASETNKGIVEEATDAETAAGTATGATGAKLFVTPAKLATRLNNTSPFNSDGSDGDLIITSGTTTIDCGGSALLIRNYNHLSITGTASIAFTNPNANGTTIILLCTRFTCTSSATRAIDTRSMGAAGGAVRTTSANTTTLAGNSGSPAIGFSLHVVNGGTGNADPSGGGGGSPGGTLTAGPSLSTIRSLFTGFMPYLMPGAGGAGGGLRTFNNGGSLVTSGAGGRGGGALAILCTGEWNFTGTIDTGGGAGTNATGSGAEHSVGGGGGGGAGTFMGIYTQLVANSGTVNSNGGIGGNCKVSGAGTTCDGSGGGASLKQSGNGGTSDRTDGQKDAGDGAPGYVLRTRNTGTFA